MSRPRPEALRARMALAAWGPGLLVMLADSDAGNIITAADAGAVYRYRLLLVPFLLIPLLYVLQELAARLALYTGQGFAAIVRAKLGRGWASLAALALAVAVFSSLVTEMTGIAGIGELYHVPRLISLTASVICLLTVAASGGYQRVERIAIVIGLLEFSFFAVAWPSHPSAAAIVADLLHPQIKSRDFLFVIAGLIGATFNPWMIFYQSSAVAQKRLRPIDHAVSRWDTATGAVLTQSVTAAVILVTAATVGLGGDALNSVGDISKTLTPLLGETIGRLLFGLGVIGASVVAAIVASLAFTWGLAELAGAVRSRRWFWWLYAPAVIGSAVTAWVAADLVALSVSMQVVNAVFLPVIAGLLVYLTATCLPGAARLRGWQLWIATGMAAIASAGGVAGAMAGLL